MSELDGACEREEADVGGRTRKWFKCEHDDGVRNELPSVSVAVSSSSPSKVGGTTVIVGFEAVGIP
jgi:hypothetical protein